MAQPKEKNITLDNPTTEDAPDLSEVDKTKVPPYLLRFFGHKFSKKIIKWTGTKEDFSTLDEVLKDTSMNQLKKMVLGGAPYLYKLDEQNYAFAHCAYYSRSDIIDMILERHKHEKTANDETEFLSQASEALKIVCQSSCGEIARMLLQAGIPIDEKEHPHVAAQHGSWVVLEEMYAVNSNMRIDEHDEQGNTPLHYATERGFTHTIKYLLDKNADPNQTNFEGSTALHLACEHADEDILYLLITRGGDVNAKEKQGKTPTRVAVDNINDGCIGILASAGANLDEKDRGGDSPLIVAASNGFSSTVKELIVNGASFEVMDKNGKNALQRAIMEKSDGAAANIIRLVLKDKYLERYIDDPEVGLLKIIRCGMKETLKALLDHALVQHPKDPHLALVQTKYIDIHIADKKNDTYFYKKRNVFLKRLADLGDEDIAYNGTVRILVERKMKKIGTLYLVFKLLFHFLFMIALSYSLIQASYENAPEAYTINPQNIIRILAELYVFFFFAYYFVSEGFEFFRVYRNRNALNEEAGKKNAATFISKLKNIIFLQAFVDYFSDRTNFFDIVGLLSLLSLIILRLTSQPAQWTFATITNLINSLRLFQEIALVPFIGPYVNIFFQILKREVPQFVMVNLFYLSMFATTYFIALRTPYTIEGFRNQSLMQDTDRVSGIDNEFYWTFVSGLRILLEGNLYDDVYVYQHLNWSAVLLYMSFLFLTVVVFLNVFIAQLSDSYSVVRENAERAYAWHRLTFVVQIQKQSLFAFLNCFKKRHIIGDITIEKDELFEYYGVSYIKNLNAKHYTEDVEVKESLASIQNQQFFARKSRSEISIFHPRFQQMQLKDNGKLNAKIDKLATSLEELMELVKKKLK